MRLAEYFAVADLTGSPRATTCVNWPLAFTWTAAPADGVPATGFAARFTGRATIAKGTYRFRASGGDSYRVWLDNTILIDRWESGALTDTAAIRTISTGVHTLRIDYRNRAGAPFLNFGWTIEENTCPNQYRGEFFANTRLSGPSVATRCYDWPLVLDLGLGSPVPGSVPADGYSARFNAVVRIEPGRYRFLAISDDGVRVWLDGILIIDAWLNQSASEYASIRTVEGGDHDITIEYYDNTQDSALGVAWFRAGDPCRSCPIQQLISPTSWDPSSFWSLRGPLNDRLARPLHAYGRDVGSFTYRTTLQGSTGKAGSIAAHLSSEHSFNNGPPNWTSDVTLIVNGTSVGTTTVIPDDGNGKLYTWAIPAGLYRDGVNTITFTVTAAALNQHGLAIYAHTTSEGFSDPITISITA